MIEMPYSGLELAKRTALLMPSVSNSKRSARGPSDFRSLATKPNWATISADMVGQVQRCTLFATSACAALFASASRATCATIEQQARAGSRGVVAFGEPFAEGDELDRGDGAEGSLQCSAPLANLIVSPNARLGGAPLAGWLADGQRFEQHSMRTKRCLALLR